ncbi:Sapep family Mn(2+)-dependent dipeptidase [Anaerococcus urinomassiliensis]|uniref:Sapep family Mn(2+)-dependent dipeptidase n=1 Tax=Anaerococcus urinomassiliensis TaxID=1745712 RepID=UPI00093D6275|nr:Sapep family Mn(2+)-dependent dipeptidase [Anaerococcus urinomassiliensis]
MKHLSEFENKLIAEIDRLRDDLISDIISLIKIPSVKGEAKADAPYGPYPKKALEKAMEIAKREGLECHFVGNHMAYSSIGNSDKYIGIFGHLDVVAAGGEKKWTYPPFAGDIVANRIYGRGALDNKGPSMAAFYGLLALKNLGYSFNHQVRMVFGSDEESGMSDLKYYLENEKPPLMGFVPDNKFPAIYGERGRAEFKISGSGIDGFYNKYLSEEEKIKEKLDLDFSDQSFGDIIVKSAQKTKSSIRIVLSTPELEIEDLLNKIKDKAKGLDTELIKYYEPAIKSRDSILVSTLNKAYNDYTGENISLNTTTGMTYAHYCPNVIGFGPSFPGQNGIAHLPDEWIDIDDLLDMAKIYAIGLYRLDKLKS